MCMLTNKMLLESDMLSDNVKPMKKANASTEAPFKVTKHKKPFADGGKLKRLGIIIPGP